MSDSPPPRKQSDDSLKRDIEEAIKAARAMDFEPKNGNRDSAADTLGYSQQSNSLLTGNSYLNFDEDIDYIPDKSYSARLADTRDRFFEKSKHSGLWLLNPFTRSFRAVRKYWIRRNTLPPTANGRVVNIDIAEPPSQIDERTRKRFCSNKVTSAMYTAYDFVPRQLVVQFSKLANLYFLFVSILQMIPSWSATGNYTTIIPLMVFVLISMIREGVEDWQRSRNDKEENNRKVLIARPSETGIDYDSVLWKDLKVGDVVRVLQNEWIPADIVLLHSSGARGQCFIETLALDGETTLKSREVPAVLQEAYRIETIYDMKGTCTVEDPNLDLFNFEGAYKFDDEDVPVVPISNNNVMYRGSVLKNTASVLGVVVFTGKETKMQMNASKNSRTKTPKLQGKVNNTVCILAAFVLLLSGFSTLASEKIQDHKSYWYIDGARVTRTQSMMGFIIMFNTLIPLSLYVSMEICKLFQKFHMQNDIDMYDAVNDVSCSVQTANLNEELGQVAYVFSDKTGTLTDNVMLFRKMCIAGHPWIHDLDLYFDDDEEGYLFHKTRDVNTIELNEEEYELLEQLSKIPRKSFGGRVSNAARKSTARVSASRPSVSRPSMSRISVSRAGPGSARLSNARPSNARPSTGTTTGSLNASLNPNAIGAGAGAAANDDLIPPRLSANCNAQALGAGSRASSRPNSGVYRSTDVAMPRMSTATVSSQWQSTAAPAKQQTVPSTLSLLEYIKAYPNNAFSEKAKFFLVALAVCHSASPEVDLNFGDDGSSNIEQLDYQASSPDELALVSAARDLGYMVIDRQLDTLTVRTYPDGFDKPPKDEQYKILDTIEFTSTRKRMSVVVQMPDGRIVLFTKGADNVIIERLKKSLIVNAHDKQQSISHENRVRRSVEAELANEHKLRNMSLRPSIDTVFRNNSFDASIQGRVSNVGRVSMPKAPRLSTQSAVSNRSNKSEKVVRLNDELNYESYTETRELEQTLEHIDEFSTEGLRTLMYGHRILPQSEYLTWKAEYDAAKASVNNRQAKVDAVGEKLEFNLNVTGATAIEDKLQKGVPEAIEKLRRANIHMWMLTGDKRETAVNIGYSCRLIKDYSTVITLRDEDNVEAKIMAAMEELNNNQITHSVVVIDGQTIMNLEKDAILFSMFIDLGLRADSVILCRASPSQKANIVKSVRKREPKKTMLAIGDGANDIAMIQAADVGIGIAGREGLQAARSSDYSIGQFRFLLKLLFVHGRWNYVRTCKYILSTFYKEFMFYMGQVIYQRNTMFTGTSLYESWSISMFNTLFTSLPVICLGVMDQDLSPTTLIAVPELYHLGQENREFTMFKLLLWMILGMLQCVMCNFLAYEFYGYNYGVSDNSIFPIGVTVFLSVVIIINLKIHFISMMHYITMLSVFSMTISVGLYILFNFLIGGVYITDPGKTYFVAREFWTELGKELSFWATVFLCITIGYFFEFSLKIIKDTFYPSDVTDFQTYEVDPKIVARFEEEAELTLHQGWEYQDNLDHSWTAFFKGKWPAQERITRKNPKTSDWIRKMQRMVGIKNQEDYEDEIQEILERRQRETQEQASLNV